MKPGAARWASAPPNMFCGASMQASAKSPPAASRFRHQRYEAAPRTSARLLKPEPPPSVGDRNWRELLDAAAARLRAAGVGCIYLVHGTFVGDDVNVAARLAAAAGPGEILVATHAATAAGLDPSLERRSLELKGKTETTEVVSLRIGPA